VLRVIDGDTIEVRVNGEVQPVRYIGVNTPEKNELCADEATAANAALVAGRDVVLVKDVSERDRFARLLRYVYADGVFVNAELVAEGYAEAVVYPPDSGHYDEFLALEATAKQAGLGCHPSGIFGVVGGGGEGGQAPTSTVAPPVAATALPSPQATQGPEATQTPQPIEPTPSQAPTATASNCDPSYPTVCIPPPPPDLDCGQIGYRRFTVLPPDPHGFDGDNDGVGCES
jgi:micrococcal nuclease